MKVVPRDDVTPICPWCETELHEVVRISDKKMFMHKGYCYVCPNCRKVLGFADWSA
jgi:uncharacterized protein with PIN domain